MREAVKAAGVDMGKLDRDLDAHDKSIMRLIKRNDDQAKALGLQGTPTYLIGPFLIAQPLNYAPRRGGAKLPAAPGEMTGRGQSGKSRVKAPSLSC